MLSLFTTVALACGVYAEDSTLIARALDGDETAIAEIRLGGESSLDELLAKQRSLETTDPRWETLVDRVAGQRYASHSGLYWYTDLEEAKAVAKASGRGIVSLRLLGRLDKDLSCANSRFFRTMLYPDPAISKAMRQNYVLHWESVREAPVITIDFGGGRKLVRTITGNSLHYILSARGEVIDVMPGLVGPTTFLGWLEGAAPVTRALSTLPDEYRAAAISAHLEAQMTRLDKGWRALTGGVEGVAQDAATQPGPEVFERLAKGNPTPLSNEARRLVELLMPRDTTMANTPGYRPSLAARAMPIAIGKAAAERPMLDVLEPVLTNLGRDDLKNRFEMRKRALIVVASQAPVGQITEAIYERLFLTPLDDPWMGLAPTDVFTGLPTAVERVGHGVGRPGVGASAAGLGR